MRGKLVEDARSRSILSRGVMNTIFLGALGYRGLAIWWDWKESVEWPSLRAALSELALALTDDSAERRRADRVSFFLLFFTTYT